jgi:outer membrane protein assembly factor BamD
MRVFRIIIITVTIAFIFISCSGKENVRPEVFVPEKEYTRAVGQIEDKEYEEARKTLIEVKNRDLTKKYAPLAQLKIADSYIREEEPELAIAEYQKFIDTYPDHQYAVYAQYQTAMAYFNQIEGPERGYSGAAKALVEFEKLKQGYPRNPYRETIDIRIQQCRDTIAAYEFLVGEFYFKKGSYRAAADRLQYLMLNYPDYGKEADALYYLGISFKRLGQEENAVKYFKRLIEKYPGSGLTRNARKEFAGLN